MTAGTIPLYAFGLTALAGIVGVGILARALRMVFPNRIGLVDPFGPAPRWLGPGLTVVNPFVPTRMIDVAHPPPIAPGSLGKVLLDVPDAPGYVVAAFGTALVVAHVARAVGPGDPVAATGRATTVEAAVVRRDPTGAPSVGA